MIEKDTSRVKYLSPEEAVQYGIIDKVLYPEDFRVEVAQILLHFLSELIFFLSLLTSAGAQVYRVSLISMPMFLCGCICIELVNC